MENEQNLINLQEFSAIMSAPKITVTADYGGKKTNISEKNVQCLADVMQNLRILPNSDQSKLQVGEVEGRVAPPLPPRQALPSSVQRKCLLTVMLRHQFSRIAYIEDVLKLLTIKDLAKAAQINRRWRRVCTSGRMVRRCVKLGGVNLSVRGTLWMYLTGMLPQGTTVQGVLAATSENELGNIPDTPTSPGINVQRNTPEVIAQSPSTVKSKSLRSSFCGSEVSDWDNIASISICEQTRKSEYLQVSSPIVIDAEETGSPLSISESAGDCDDSDSSQVEGEEKLPGLMRDIRHYSDPGVCKTSFQEAAAQIEMTIEGILSEGEDSSVNELDKAVEFYPDGTDSSHELALTASHLAIKNKQEESDGETNRTKSGATLTWLSSKLENVAPDFSTLRSKLQSISARKRSFTIPSSASITATWNQYDTSSLKSLMPRKRKSAEHESFQPINDFAEGGRPDIERIRGLFEALVNSSEMFTPDLIEVRHRMNSRRSHHNTIDMDVRRTPRLEDVGATQLRAVLSGVCLFLPDVGYVQGMNYIAHFFIKYMNSQPEDAFWVIVALLSRPDMQGLFTPGMPVLHLRFFQLSHLLERHAPYLAAHLEDLGIPPNLYATSWFITLLTDFTVIPMDQLLILWDILFLHHNEPSEQWAIVFNCLIMTLVLAEGLFLQLHEFDQVLHLMHRLPFKELSGGVVALLVLAKKRLEKDSTMKEQLQVFQQKWNRLNASTLGK